LRCENANCLEDEMMNKVRDETIHERRVVVNLDAFDVHRLLEAEALRLAGLRAGAPGVIAQVEVEQEEEGSPSYKVDRWRARVRITQNLSP
jgi:hypothetical protein